MTARTLWLNGILRPVKRREGRSIGPGAGSPARIFPCHRLLNLYPGANPQFHEAGA
jgi:hypothetical protein